MDVYFIRHGQTDGNVASRHQHANTPLNEVGIEQAKVVAKVLLDYNPTHLVTSTQKRALTTASYISETTGLIPETSDDLVEILRPLYLVGERRGGWRMVVYMSLWYFGYRPASRHDGESYEEMRQRMRRAKNHLATFPSDAKVVVVSHAGFITFFLAHLNYDNALSVFEALGVLWRMTKVRNAQIIHLSYDTKEKEWHIES
ncbi:MAG: histidine phosphatase family protein [Candidatus Paceibacteria bacterium]